MKYYIAYGSNLNRDQMRSRCPSAVPVGTGMLDGYELSFRGTRRGTGFLSIDKKEGARVPVGIWKITKADEASLDAYEGFPRLYRKETVRVRMCPFCGIRTQVVDAIVYIMNDGHPLTPPSSYYFKTCDAGYYDFFLDYEFLDDALSRADDARVS